MTIETFHTSLTGRKSKNCVNQDSYAIVDNERYYFAVVADGLGSCLNSHIGSKTVCDVIKFFGEQDCIDFENIEKRIDIAWSSVLAENNIVADTACTTLSYVCIEKNKSLVHYGKVGDSPLALIVDGKSYVLNNQSKEFLNETDCLGFKKFKFEQSTYRFKESVKFIITTDGIGDEIDWKKLENLMDFFYRLFHESNLITFNSAIKETFENLNEDDKTIIIGYLTNDN